MKFPKKKKITGFTDEKHEAVDDPLPSSPSPSTWYTFKTSPCMPAPRAHVENTCARGAGIHGVFSVSHTTHTTHHTTTHHNNTTTTPHRDRHRERDIERRGDEREERREKREDPFSVWWCMAVFCWCSDFPVNSVCARDCFSLLNSVKCDSFWISVPLCRLTVF